MGMIAEILSERLAAYGYMIVPFSAELDEIEFTVINLDGENVGYVSSAQNFRTLFTEDVMFIDVDGEDRGAPLRRLRRFVAINPEMGFRVYQTHSGLRLLCTSHRMRPDRKGAAHIFGQLGADPNYVKSCGASGYYSSRLEPKPGRFTGRKADFASAKYLFAEGSPLICPNALTVLKFYEAETGAHTDLPLLARYQVRPLSVKDRQRAVQNQ